MKSTISKAVEYVAMAKNIEDMSPEELDQMSRRIATARRTAMRKMIAPLYAQYHDLMPKIEAACKQLEIPLALFQGHPLDDIIGFLSSEPDSAGVGRGARRVSPKFRHPTNQSLIWSGRGSHPVWVREYLSGGGALDELRIEGGDADTNA